MTPEQEAIVWICIAAFASTVIITILALTNLIKLGRTDAAHDRFLRLFVSAIILEIAVGAVYAFSSLIIVQQDVNIRNPAAIVTVESKVVNLQNKIKQIDDQLSALNAQPTKAVNHWELLQTGDCGNHDIDRSDGAEPVIGKCSAPDVTAVCWDGVLFKNGPPWCTYKRIVAAACVGGASPGRVFRCAP